MRNVNRLRRDVAPIMNAPFADAPFRAAPGERKGAWYYLPLPRANLRHPRELEIDGKGLRSGQYAEVADPITRVVGEPLDCFEGALFPSPSGKPRWLIAYNSALTSKGRIRFIQAHELGHYLLHRQPGRSIRCRTEDTWILDPAYQRQEAEANSFASFLLMPLNDYSAQVTGQQIDLDLFKRCATRYGVSLTAAILKWLEFTPVVAVLVCSCDGFINWAVSSKPAMRTGTFFRTRGRPPTPVPEASLAAVPPANLEPAASVDHPHGVWFASLPATEFAIASWRYDMTLSLLVLRNEDTERELTGGAASD